MVLEATMIILDTTEFMRNGDYFPTRLAAEQEAAFAIFSAKMRANPQNSVGLMTLSGQVKASFVTNSGKFQAGIRETQIEVKQPTLASAIQVGQLALRHRHHTQQQRIVVFIGSPIEDTDQDLKKLGARLKKNNIAIDVVSFGQEGENGTRLREFVSAVNSGDNSHFVDVPPGPDDLADIISQSNMVREGGAEADAFLGNDMDMEDDPELAMALRMSLEEEQQRQGRATQT